MGISSTVRRHLREVRAALRVVVSVLGTVVGTVLGTVVGTVVGTVLLAGRRAPEPGTPVATARSLVVLVHGFGAGPDCWDAVADALGGPGVAVVTHRYTWTARVEELGARLADEVEDLARRSGARSVTLVGHSLGGVIVAASLVDGRLDGVVTRVVTLAAPLRGTPWARLFPLGAVRDLRAGAPLLRAIASRPVDVPWTTVASRADVVVSAQRATLPGAEAIVVDSVGHCGLLRDAAVVACIARVAGAAFALPARRVVARPALTVVA